MKAPRSVNAVFAELAGNVADGIFAVAPPRRVSRRLLDLAEAGLTTRCQDPATGLLWLSDDHEDHALAATLCEGCVLLRRCFQVADQNGNLRNPDRRKANVMEQLLDQLNGAIDGIASCLADPIHDEWFETGKATQTLKEAARRLNDIAHGIQIERDQYLEFMSE